MSNDRFREKRTLGQGPSESGLVMTALPPKADIRLELTVMTATDPKETFGAARNIDARSEPASRERSVGGGWLVTSSAQTYANNVFKFRVSGSIQSSSGC